MTSADDNDVKTNGVSKENNRATSDPNELEKQIIRQVEFYFGDANLPRDKFMLELIKTDDGWIPMSTMLKFQRLAKLTTDKDVIAEALRKSDLIEVNTEGEEPKIRRSPNHPLPELNAERRKEINERTVYCKGFPQSATVDDVLVILEPYGPTENVIMRKYKDSVTQNYLFKGSIFATFPTKEKAEAFLDVSSIKAGETELVRLWSVDYYEKKKNESKKKDSKKNKKTEEEEEAVGRTLKKGSTIRLNGEISEDTKWSDIKDAFTALEIDVSFITFNKGDKTAIVRLPEENAAKGALEKIENVLTVNDVKLDAVALDEEEEEKFLQTVKMEMTSGQKRKNMKHGGGKKFKGGRGRRRDNGAEGGRGKRKDKSEDGGPPAKKVAT